MIGTVKWFSESKGFGFIESKSGGDYFVHFTEIEGQGFRNLQEGDEVSFELGEGRKGPCAVKVQKLGGNIFL